MLTAIGGWFGASGFIGLPAFATGAIAIGIVSGAYQAEVFRGAFAALSRGELEAARAIGMGFRLVTVGSDSALMLQAARAALQGVRGGGVA